MASGRPPWLWKPSALGPAPSGPWRLQQYENLAVGLAENQVPAALSTNITRRLLGQKADHPASEHHWAERRNGKLSSGVSRLCSADTRQRALPHLVGSGARTDCGWCLPRESLSRMFFLFSDLLLDLHCICYRVAPPPALYQWPSVHSTGPGGAHEGCGGLLSQCSPRERAASSLHTSGGAILLLPQSDFGRQQQKE